MKVIYTIIVVLVVLFVITFSLENTVSVQVKYYDFIDVSRPIYQLLFIVFLSGVIFTGFMGIIERYRLNRTIAKLNRTVRELKRQIRTTEYKPLGEESTPAE
ncbi:MAG: LapA family protein [Syntrophales bacterium]